MADFVSEQTQPSEVIKTNGSGVADMMLHRQFAVKPDTDIVHDASAVNGWPTNQQTVEVGRDLCKANTSWTT